MMNLSSIPMKQATFLHFHGDIPPPPNSTALLGGNVGYADYEGRTGGWWFFMYLGTL